MTRPNWTLEEAATHLGAVPEDASHGEPQTITLRGGTPVIVVATRDYARHYENTSSVSVPPNFVDRLLVMPLKPEEAL